MTSAGALRPDPRLDRLDELEHRFRAGERGPNEQELRRARLEAVDAVLGVDRGPVPAATTPPAVGPSGLPETTASALEPGIVRAAYESHGCIVVRGLVDTTHAMELTAGIDTAIDAWSNLQRPFATPTGDPWFDAVQVDEPRRAALGRTWVTNGAGLLTFDSPRMLARILDLYTALGLRNLVTDLLGARPVLSANKCTLRRVPPETNAGWHQDGAFLGRQLRATNVWVTLTDCGLDAPGLDIVPRRFGDVVETGTRGAIFDWSVSEEIVAELHEDTPIVRPVLQAGDAVIFDELLLHRTATDPAMTRSRYAIEMWTFAGTDYPAGHVPLVW